MSTRQSLCDPLTTITLQQGAIAQPWRTVLEQVMPDHPDLAVLVSGILDRLEGLHISLHRHDRKPETIDVGQLFFSRLAYTLECFNAWNLMPTLQENGYLPNKRFQIKTTSDENCVTFMQAHNDKPDLPLQLLLHPETLQTYSYRDIRGGRTPLSIEAVLVHELAHLAFATTEEEIPMMIEQMLVDALGGVPRLRLEDFQNNNRPISDVGYKTLQSLDSRKTPPPKHNLKGLAQ